MAMNAQQNVFDTIRIFASYWNHPSTTICRLMPGPPPSAVAESAAMATSCPRKATSDDDSKNSKEVQIT
jgi:hypothetical protein